MMNNQMQPFEENLSAIMDGELSGEELLQSIDALVENGELRGFWRDSRSLQKALAKPETGLVEAPPERVWENVEHSAGERKAKVIPLKRMSPQVWAAAASIVLIFSLTLAGLFRGAIPEQANARTIQLGQNDNKMTEQRFLELTTELLRADSRYHRKMLEVMQTVNREVYGVSGDLRSEEGRPRNEELNGEALASANLEDDVEPVRGEMTGEFDEPRRGSEDNEAPVRLNLW